MALDKNGIHLSEGDTVMAPGDRVGEVIILEGASVFVRFDDYKEIGDVVENVLYSAAELEKLFE